MQLDSSLFLQILQKLKGFLYNLLKSSEIVVEKMEMLEQNKIKI
jgi:hypothetical protein